ncbi:MAG: hypothetical protein JWN76_267 [Chitinophagaceae bacterium]|nr:hypothetical protein [Chitinophagaceae bacterium]
MSSEQAEMKQPQSIIDAIIKFFKGKPKPVLEEKKDNSTEEWNKAYDLAVQQLKKK